MGARRPTTQAMTAQGTTPRSPAASPGQGVLDAVVVGSGFGGLGAALSLAERGARVVLCEALNYPGGCASTFSRDGYRFEAGATLFSGFAQGQLFRRWIDAHGLEVPLDWLEPVVELRAPLGEDPAAALAIGRHPGDLERALAALPGAPAEALARFFALQRRVADTLWEVLEDERLLPPLGPAALARHALRLPRYAPLASLVGRPLSTVLARYGLADWQPLRLALDALCQITVQCGVDEAEAPMALSVMDYYSRGTAHVRGGIGTLATAMAGAIERAGSEVRFSSRVRSARREGDLWAVETRTGTLRARALLLNLLPEDAARLLDSSSRRLARLQQRVEGGWGAAMLYRVVRTPSGAPASPHHLQLVADAGKPLRDGNHCFVSISGEADAGRAPEGHRTVTVSTHVAIGAKGDAAARTQEVQDRMRATLALRAPEWEETVHELPGSPRTFARFTGRTRGWVGGIPRRAGLANYGQLGPLRIDRAAWLIGDTAFPGQSTLATATGGVQTATAVLKSLR